VLCAETISHITTYWCPHPHLLWMKTQWPPHHPWPTGNAKITFEPSTHLQNVHVLVLQNTHLKNSIIREWGRNLYCDHHLCTHGSPHTMNPKAWTKLSQIQIHYQVCAKTIAHITTYLCTHYHLLSEKTQWPWHHFWPTTNAKLTLQPST